MQNKRYVKMNEFLKDIVKIMKLNPSFAITDRFIYGKFMEYGQYPTQREKNNKLEIALSEAKRRTLLFYNWDMLAKKMPHISTFITRNDPNNHNLPHFFAFNNGKVDYSKEIKLYFNFDDEHLEDNLSYIMNFLAANNIVHESKVGSAKRADSIVIRVDDVKNALAIINFINTNPILANHLGEVNPFTPKVMNIGVATDEYSSYNNEISALMTSYLSEKQRINDLDNVSIEGFKKHISFLRNRRAAFMQEDDKFYDFLLQTMDQDFVDSEVFALLARKQNIKQISTHTDQEIGNLLNHALITNYEKYDLGWTITALRRYIESGDASSITKDKNARSVLKLILTKEEVFDYISRQVDTRNRDYLTIFVSKMVEKYESEKRIEEQDYDDIHLRRMNLVQKVAIETATKYSERQLAVGLERYEMGDASLLTNTNNARANLMNEIGPDEIFQLTKLTLVYYFNIDMLNSPDRKSVYECYANQISLSIQYNKKVANEM